ncbi:helix-turn-helix domain-containing protein [Undibacterium oligocarboniphilum]|uniref:Helix-turn-helix transcriptional regulator n=1 Tax=Undibacterium oligocarboniphilum TaxID=666702 RepID=A0A850QJ27_9BURK|nr:helix-turn-helix transcriptional regulator [Undibacterium oligocarboniphilum]MBC3869859.1 helix-turn-helix transcriptional regulator [Undibacterium oligocarboniphilum]NVO77475.1 helix-turn-helix transcriptional regulator [Undibacterium oligocarboniphilum]
MSSPELLISVLRSELRAAGVTYKMLAEQIGMSESSVKRMFGQKDMSLSRLAQICKASGVAMEDVLRQAADVTPHSDTLTLAQEKSLMAEPKLLLVAICCLGHWTLEQIVETYSLSQAECILHLIALDKLELIELRPNNRYRLNVSAAFHWRPDGPVQQYFREHVVSDYFNGRFDQVGETLLCVPARVSIHSAQEVVQKIQQLVAELARLHQDDRKLQPEDRDGFTLLVGFRSWEFSTFTALRRPEAKPELPVLTHQISTKKR